MKYDHDVRDQEDIVFASNRIEQYAVHREGSSAGIKHFANFVDEFGHKGGFERILDFFNQVASGKVVASLEHLGLVLAFLSRTMPLWPRHFMCYYMKRVDQAYLGALAAEGKGSPFSVTVTRAQINITTAAYHMLLRRFYVNRAHHNMVNYLNLQIGSTLLNGSNLEKRILGIKIVSDQISNSRY